mmetsp:Transcript_13182/g.2032  ORF Transcript_13182/g.2032 Transcript_13182/m.2032 type:complete len:102 (+) Transcript_13182:1211-1516(+)
MSSYVSGYYLLDNDIKQIKYKHFISASTLDYDTSRRRLQTTEKTGKVLGSGSYSITSPSNADNTARDITAIIMPSGFTLYNPSIFYNSKKVYETKAYSFSG